MSKRKSKVDNAVETFGISPYEIAAIELATGLCFDPKDLPLGFISTLLDARNLWEALPAARTIGDMARAFAAWRVEALQR